MTRRLDGAVDILQRLGAHNMERAEGSILAGDWTDFNPNSLPQPV